MKKILISLTLLVISICGMTYAADGKRNPGAACLPEQDSDAKYIHRAKGGKLVNWNSSSSHKLNIVCPILNDDMSESKTKVSVYVKGHVYCGVFTYTKTGANVDDDFETVNSGSSIKSMSFDVDEVEDGSMELFCHIYGGSELISYNWIENI